MSEKDIERIEKKVDLLYKILLKLRVDTVGHPYSQEYINKFMDELIPLFELSVDEEIEVERLPTQKEVKETISRLKTELSRLKKVYKSGDFLAKDEDKIKSKIKVIADYLGCYEEDSLTSGVIAEISKNIEEITSMNKEIYERNLFVDLKKKLGLGVNEEEVYISYHEDYDGWQRINLIERRDVLKNKTEDFIKKIRKLGKE